MSTHEHAHTAPAGGATSESTPGSASGPRGDGSGKPSGPPVDEKKTALFARKGKKKWQCGKCGAKFELSRRYDLRRCLGHGAYGYVFSAMDMKLNQKIAIKKIHRIFTHPLDARRTLRELVLMRYMDHENLLSLHDVARPKDADKYKEVYMMMDLMDADLHYIIDSGQELSTEHIQYIMWQMLRGIRYMHKLGIVHRDLKPSNVLVTRKCGVKLADFGLARIMTDAELHPDPDADEVTKRRQIITAYVTTRWYRAPEVIVCSGYDFEMDIWSVGCIFAELLMRKPIFPGRDYLNMLERITDVLGTPKLEDMTFVQDKRVRQHMYNWWWRRKPGIDLKELIPQHVATPEALDLLQGMLQFNPAKRLTADQALAHPYFEHYWDYLRDVEGNADWEPLKQLPFEHRELSIDELKVLIYEESLHYHPLSEPDEESGDDDDDDEEPSTFGGMQKETRRGKKKAADAAAAAEGGDIEDLGN